MQEKIQRMIDRMILPVIFGMDDKGNYVVEDLRNLGHILIGGCTGTGKSAFNQTVIYILAQKYNHKELKFLLLDSKITGLCDYEKLPHLMSDIPENPEKCLSELGKVLKEKNRRTEKLRITECNDIALYNKRFPNNKISYLVIIIDTFCDIAYRDMARFKNIIPDIMNDSVRLGIHFVMCDSRISSEIYSDKIKGCFSCRIAFQTATADQSEIIIDESGAEKLNDHGEMLVFNKDRAIGRIEHIKSLFISPEVIEEFVKRKSKNRLNQTLDSSFKEETAKKTNLRPPVRYCSSGSIVKEN